MTCLVRRSHSHAYTPPATAAAACARRAARQRLPRELSEPQLRAQSNHRLVRERLLRFCQRLTQRHRWRDEILAAPRTSQRLQLLWATPGHRLAAHRRDGPCGAVSLASSDGAGRCSTGHDSHRACIFARCAGWPCSSCRVRTSIRAPTRPRTAQPRSDRPARLRDCARNGDRPSRPCSRSGRCHTPGPTNHRVGPGTCPAVVGHAGGAEDIHGLRNRRCRNRPIRRSLPIICLDPWLDLGAPPEMHSRFLETAAEGGIVGLTAFFALIGLVSTAGIRAAAHLIQV